MDNVVTGLKPAEVDQEAHNCKNLKVIPIISCSDLSLHVL